MSAHGGGVADASPYLGSITPVVMLSPTRPRPVTHRWAPRTRTLIGCPHPQHRRHGDLAVLTGPQRVRPEAVLVGCRAARRVPAVVRRRSVRPLPSGEQG